MRMGNPQIYYDQHPAIQDPGATYFPSQMDGLDNEWTSLDPKVIHSARPLDREDDGTIFLPETREMSNMQRFLQCHESRALFSTVPACYRGPVDSKPYTFHGVDMQNPWSHKPMMPSVASPYGYQIDHRSSFDQDSLSSGSVLSPRTNETYPDYETASDRRVSTPCDALAYGSDHGAHTGFQRDSSSGISSALRGIAPSQVLRYPETPADADAIDGDFHNEPQLQDGAMSAPYYGNAPTLARSGVRPARSLPEDEGIGSSINDDSMDSTCSEIGDMEMGDNKDEDTDYKPSQRTKSSLRRRCSKSSNRNTNPVMSRRTSSARFPPHKITKSTPRSSTSTTRMLTRSPRPPTAFNRAIPGPQIPSSNTVTNRDKHICARCPQSYASNSALHKHIQSTHTRPFSCTFARYGCPSTFGSKNEWKRHVTSQHLRPGIWRCDIGNCVPKPNPPARRNGRNTSLGEAAASAGGWNEFNRKDLFTQHVRRMHGPPATAPRAEKEAFEVTLEGIRERCWQDLRPSPPRSVCGFCVHAQKHRQLGGTTAWVEALDPPVYEGVSAWEERMEHVGRHLEKQSMREEEEDVGLRDWMVQEGLVSWERGSWRVVGIAEGKKRGGRGVKVEIAPDDGEEDAEGEDE